MAVSDRAPLDSSGNVVPAPKRLLNANFLLLAQGAWVSEVGTQIALVATTIWLRKTTNSAGLIGVLNTISALPLLLLSPIGGALADRWFRRNSLIVCDCLSGLISCALMVLVMSGLPISTTLAGLFAATLLLASTSAFTNPAFNALVPDLVEPLHLPKAIGITQASGLIAIICGQALGGLLAGYFPSHVLFGIDAATYFVSASACLWVRAPRTVPKVVREEHALKRMWTEIQEGLQYVWRRRGMRVLMLSAIPLNVFTTPVFIFLPFYTTNALGQPLSRYGYLLAGFSLGLLSGYIAAARIPSNSPQTTRTIFGCVLANAVICIIVSIIGWYWLALLLLFALGCSTGMVTLLCLNVITARTDPEKRGRVASFLVMIAQGLTPSLMSLIGLVADSLGGNVRPLYAACGAILFVLGATLSMNTDLRRFLEGVEGA